MTGSATTLRDLRADCAHCAGLCCVVPAFSRSAEFAVDKPAERPCPNLRDDFRCGIHDRLRPSGFSGCAVFDCFGAGQRVTQAFGGRDWTGSAQTAQAMFAAFRAMRNLHELLRYAVEAADVTPPGPLATRVAEVRDLIDGYTRLAPDRVVDVDAAALHRVLDPLLEQVSAQVRGPGGADRRRAALVGADLRRADLRRATLRGARLLGADLRGANLAGADLLGADLRAARLDGADLTGCLFLTQPQIDAAAGDAATSLPSDVRRPAHWPARAKRR